MVTGFRIGDGSDWIYDNRLSTAATSWKALAELGVNPLDPNLYLGESCGIPSVPPVSPVISISNGILHIKNAVAGETLQFFSVTGILLYQMTVSESNNADYPVPCGERLLIVKSSSGWCGKVIQT
jgi:hypothetical protein